MPLHTYEPINWEDAPSVATPLSAENLNHMDNGIGALFADLAELSQAIEDLSVPTSILSDIQNNFATPVTGDTAMTDYAIGDYILKDSHLYAVTAIILSGEAFEVGTNIEQTTVGAELVKNRVPLANNLNTTDEGYALDARQGLALEGLLNARTSDILGDIAPVETSPIAGRQYDVGDHLVLARMLYKVTAAISVGDTIVPGTNVVQTTVANGLANASPFTPSIATNTKAVAISATSIDTYAFGAELTLAPGTYIIIGNGSFNSVSGTTGVRVNQVVLCRGSYSNISVISDSRVRVPAGAPYYSALQTISAVTLAETERFVVAVSSTMASSASNTYITAVRIG